MSDPDFAERYAAFARFNPEHVARRLRCLAANLAQAGGLCAAFEQGRQAGQWWSSYFDGFYQDDDDVPPFQPGCSRSATP
jgi:hypothetical protein